MQQSTHYHIGLQQTSAYSGSTSCYRDAGQHYMEFNFTFVRVYYLTTVEGKEFLPGSSLSNLDFGSRFKDFAWLRIGALCLYYLSGTPTLRSFIYEDVGEPTSHPCS